MKIHKFNRQRVNIIGAHIKHSFEKGFLLDEEKLRKIHDIISKRIVDNNIEYSVYQVDSYSFKTKRIDDVINHENLKLSKISSLEINFERKYANLNLSIDFDDSGASLSIDGENRDNVFLLSSELKEYISNEVCTQRMIRKNFSKYVFYVFFGTFILFIAFLFSSNSSTSISRDAIDNVLKSNDTNEKINLLIQKNFKDDLKTDKSSYGVYLFLGWSLSMGLLLFSEKLEKASSYFFPANLFLFGKEIERYNNLLETRSKIIWGIGIALFISIIGSLIVWWMTLKT
ncbi:Uncharacterised protein [uncultured archaeon]|nr:Uncharacterised protein [uncultured archaeon]